MPDQLIMMRDGTSPEQLERLAATAVAHGVSPIWRCPPCLLAVRSKDSHWMQGWEGKTWVTTGPVDLDNRLLDKETRLALRGWNRRQAGSFLAEKAARLDDGKTWDFHESDGSDIRPVTGGGAPESVGKSFPKNTSRYLTGTVAVGLVLVSGPESSAAAFSDDERDQAMAEVQEGLTNLAALAPPQAFLQFIFDIHDITLDLDPAGVRREKTWREPLLAQLGYGSGMAGMYAYLHHLRTNRWPEMDQGPDWAYLAFITKYATPAFAYAALGGPRLVIRYDNNGWGPHQIDRVFAHETGHIFHAPDEYGRCRLGGKWGYLGGPNDNCVRNPQSVNCLMKGNTYEICDFTRTHFGWRDSGNDGVLDPLDQSFATEVGFAPPAEDFDQPDLWLRRQDDGEGHDTHQSPVPEKDHFIYARVSNFGALDAEIIRVRFYLADFPATEMVFPDDFTQWVRAEDTPYPTVFGLKPHANAIARVRLPSARLPATTWYPTLLAHVTCPQQPPVPAGTPVWASRQLAQRSAVTAIVAPARTTTIPVVLQNRSGAHATFEMQRLDAPENLDVSLQWREQVMEAAIPATSPNRSQTAAELSPPLPQKRGKHVFLPVSTAFSSFQIPITGPFRKPVGIRFTPPRTARAGDRYTLALVQRDEANRFQGAVHFSLRVGYDDSLVDQLKPRLHMFQSVGESQTPNLAQIAEQWVATGRRTTGKKPSAARPSKVKPMRPASLASLGFSADEWKALHGASDDLDVLQEMIYLAQERLLLRKL